MSVQATTIQQRLSQHRFSHAIGRLRLSPLEMLFLAAAIGFALFVGYFYLYEVKPLNDQIVQVQNEMAALHAQVKTDKERAAQLERQRANAARILSSRDTFEAYLQRGETGKAAIIDEFEALAKRFQITTGDFAFKPVEAQPLVDANGQLLKEAIRNDRLNVYPALGMETTVIGDYLNLRRFLAALEKSRQFLIVNAVSFQGEADKRLAAAKSPAAQPTTPNPVSLKIEMETYFRREGR